MQKSVRFYPLSLFFVLSFLTIGCSSSETEPTGAGGEATVKTAKVNVVPEVSVIAVQNENIGAKIELTGRLKALRSVSVTAEVQGKVLQQKKELEVGVTFRKGETLARIERTQSDLNLYASRAKFNTQIINLLSDLEADHPEVYPKWKAYTEQFDFKKLLPELPDFVNDREKYLFNLRNIPGQYLDLKAQEEQLTKYTIKAPFNGIITQANVDYGDIVSPNSPIAELLGTDVYEYETAVNEQALAYLTIGSKVKLRNTATGAAYEGRILRTGGIINSQTQTIPVYISVRGKGLRQGTYLEGVVDGKSYENVTAVATHLITRNNEVYIVQGDAIQLLPIEKVGQAGGKILVKGIPDGTLLVNQTVSSSTLRGKIKPIRSQLTQTVSLK